MRSKDLSAQFGRPATAQTRGLDGLLPPRRTPPPLPDSGVADTEEEAAPPEREAASTPGSGSGPDESVSQHDAQESGPSPRRRAGPSRRLHPAPAAKGVAQSFQVPAYVLPSVKNAAQQRRVRDRLTNAEIAFAAIDASFAQLHQLIRARRTVDRGPTSLFPPRTRRAMGSSAQPDTRRVPWVLQATAEEMSVLDGLVTELGAESRSELIAIALEAHLLGKQKR